MTDISHQLAAELAAARARGDRASEAYVLLAQGKLALLAGDKASADQKLDQAVTIYQSLGDGYSIAAQTGNYGWALRRAGQPAAARPYLLHAAELFAKLGLDEYAERHLAAANDGAALLTPELLASLPPAVRGALERGDQTGLQGAVNALDLASQQLVLQRLAEAGLIAIAEDSDDEASTQFEPLLQDIVAVARGDGTQRAEIEAALTELESKGWLFGKAIAAIWAGERDEAKLTKRLDQADATIVLRVLELLADSR
ncbi:MAG: tetratricopeptide repeat protein [Chloroflexaceae bacterium]|jgi:hypothetical protein|nr:tetratricopeptide repeat protein [Chloroflexaceae bacterium]